MVSEKQRDTIHAIGRKNENRNTADEQLGISRAALRMRLSRAFDGFMEDLVLFSEYYEVFEKEFKRNPQVYTRLRSIARKVRPGS